MHRQKENRMSTSSLAEDNARPERLPRRERENLRQRGEILEAALRLFSEKGYHNVSMHEIAKEAEFGIGTMYKFFLNKKDLYKILIMGTAEKWHDTVLQALGRERNPCRAIKRYIAAHRELFFSDFPVVRMYYAETKGACFNIEAGFDQDLLRLRDERIDKLVSVFEAGIKENVFRELDPYHMAVALHGIIDAFLFRMMEDPARFQASDELADAAEIFLGGVLNK
jgi:TetR/AcrR family transcriptional regulator